MATQTDESHFQNSMIIRMPIPGSNNGKINNFAKIMISISNGNALNSLLPNYFQ